MTIHPNASKRAIQTFTDLESKYLALHNHKYSYDKAVYFNSKTKFIITCPIHGDFEQCHNKHYSTKQGCPKCTHSAPHTTESFVQKASEVHNHLYDYSKTIYTGIFSQVTVTCKYHGDFSQQATNHLSGKGCDKCARESQGLQRRLTFKNFVAQSNQVHSNKYTYKNYTKRSAKVTITCPIHGEFTQDAGSHLSGCGCPSCASYGFDMTKPAILYYLSINNGETFKVGITNRTVEERFSNTDLAKITVLHTECFSNGQDCYLKEQLLLSQYSNFKYEGPNLLQSGNTELLTVNPLTKDL